MRPGGSSARTLRVAIIAASALALAAVAAILLTAGTGGTGADELMYGGPLSFDMVHTHILNMKMRRSRLKEKLKQAALKRKDREIAQEHGFDQGSMVGRPAPALSRLRWQLPLLSCRSPSPLQLAPSACLPAALTKAPGGRRTCAGRQCSCTCAAAADDGPAAAAADVPVAARAAAGNVPAAPAAAADVPAAAHAAAADADDGAGAPAAAGLLRAADAANGRKFGSFALTSRVESAPHTSTLPFHSPSLTLLSHRAPCLPRAML